jgi:hypothetical protein
MSGPRTRKPSPDIAVPSRFACPGTARLLRSRAMGEDRPEPVPGHVE